MTALSPTALLGGTGTPITRTAGWWREMAEDCDAAAGDANLPRSLAKEIGAVLDKIEWACDGRDDDEAVTVVLSERERTVLDVGGWLEGDGR